ncbi:hypothetical protein GCM10010199_54010 [Dactylosporangium roseum]
MRRRFKWLAVRRFLSLLFGISVALWILIYLIAWAAVPRGLAEEWAKQSVSLGKVDIFGWIVAVPLGPYVAVASLLSTVACVGFLGFALTEDQYSDALWDAVVTNPAKRYLIWALPYVAITGIPGIDSAKPGATRPGKNRNRK